MSEYRTMAFEGKNLRDEEKILDDKLMELGLLEPGMSLQEKRDLAAVLLESTQMAQEQMTQRVQEEQWEVMQILPDENNKSSNKIFSNKPELITIPDEPEPEILNAQEIDVTKNKRMQKELEQNNNNNRYERERRGNRERRGELRSDKDRREDCRTTKMCTRNNKLEKEEVVDNAKGMNKREDEEAKDKQLREIQKREHRERREEEMRRRETRKNEIEREAKKAKSMEAVRDTTNEHKKSAVEKVEGEKILKDSFYGPSYLRDVKHPSPLRLEVYGSAQKSRPKKVGQESLIKLAEDAMKNKETTDAMEECIMKGNVFRKEIPTREKKTPLRSQAQADSKELVSCPKAISVDSVDDAQNKFLRKSQKNFVEGSSEEYVDQTPKKHCKEERLFPKEVKNRRTTSENAPVSRNDRLLSLATKVEHNKGMYYKGNCEKRRRNEKSNSENSSTGGEIQEANTEEGIQEGNGDLPEDVQVQGEKKRRLEMDKLVKRWADVVTSEKSEESITNEEVDEKDIGEVKPKITTMPNKRWRRVRRKYKSSFGSGSEVDEWISSEEEKKTEVNPVSKEEVIARFDDYLSHLKGALHKERLKVAGQGNKHLCNYSCKQKKKYKVPPGFQEPDSDSDDEYNLWKICFGDKYSKKNKPLNRDPNDDSIQMSESRSITRSKLRNKDFSSRSRSSSKSPSSLEGDHLVSRSPLQLSPVKEMLPSLILSNEEVSSVSKSPSLKDITLFDKVACPIRTISRCTQTQWDDDMDSNQSSSSCVTGTNSTSKHITPEPKPMWDLFDVDSEMEKVVENSMNPSISKVNDEMRNVTAQRPKKNRNPSPCYLLDPEEDLEPSTSFKNATVEDIGRNSLGQSLCRPPISERATRRESKERILALENFPGKVNEEIEDNSEDEKELLVDPAMCQEESTAEQPESVVCPICSQFFPMNEIEVHASGCNPEEDDDSSQEDASSSPQLGRGQRLRAGRVALAEEAGASYKRFKLGPKEEEEEEMEDDDIADFEKEEDFKSERPRPPPLSTFVPISQQKDSLIDYSDQFPTHSGNINIQTSLERIRKTLMRGRGKKKSGWRKKKRGKWRSFPKK